MLASQPDTAEIASGAIHRQFGVGEQSDACRLREQVGQMQDGTTTLEPGEHPEVRLVPHEEAEPRDSGLIELRGRLEQQPAERNGGIENCVKPRGVCGVQPQERSGRVPRYDRECAQKRVAMTALVAGDELGIVEIIAGEHPHALGEPTAQVALASCVEKGDLDTEDGVGMGMGEGHNGVDSGVEVVTAPVAGQLRVEHLT
ncbi:hypothetical protein SDC9_133974 [bioreactor metagenome]|uniref:Uncharacterized protein n=1 Tax=bioreactor metagenome TaxID=1076179 RepID=A0A645DC32_9ZZZZ